MHGTSLKIRIKSSPVDGKANRELVRFLAEILDIPQGQITIIRGASGRRKTVAIEGLTAERATRVLGLVQPR